MKFKCTNCETGCPVQGTSDEIISHLEKGCKYQKKNMEDDSGFLNTPVAVYIAED